MSHPNVPVNIGVYWPLNTQECAEQSAKFKKELASLTLAYPNTVFRLFDLANNAPDKLNDEFSKAVSEFRGKIELGTKVTTRLFSDDVINTPEESDAFENLDLIISVSSNDNTSISQFESDLLRTANKEITARDFLNTNPIVELIKVSSDVTTYWQMNEALETKEVSAEKLSTEKTNELKNLDEYNQSLKSWQPKHEKYSYPLMSKKDIEDCDIAGGSGVFDTHQQFTIADATAVRMQKRSNLLIMWITTLALISATVFLVNAHLFKDHQVLLMGIYICCLAVSFGSSKIGASLGLFEKHLQSRCIAELLRIKFFWDINESTQCKRESFYQHLVFRSYHPIQWLSTLIKNESSRSVVSNQTKKAHALVVKHWLKDQKAYFTKAISKNQKNQKSVNLMSILALLIAIASSIVSVSVHLNVSGFPAFISGNKQGFVFLAGWLALFVATIEVYRLKMADEDVNQLNKRMLKILTNAEVLLAQSNNLKTNQLIIRSLLKEAAIENVEWYNLKNVRNINNTQTGLQRLVVS